MLRHQKNAGIHGGKRRKATEQLKQKLYKSLDKSEGTGERFVCLGFIAYQPL